MDRIKSKYLDNCTYAKTILMIIIVFYHSIAFWGGQWFEIISPVYSATFLSYLTRWLNSFHVYAFTLISGYLFAFLYWEKGKYQDFGPFVVNKIKRLIIPYIFVCVIWIIPVSHYFYNYSILDIVLKFALGIAPAQLWFLLMLFIVFIIIWLLNIIIIKHYLVGYAITLFLYCVGIIGNKCFLNVLCVWTALQYIPFFYIGMRIRFNHSNNKEQIVDSIPCFALLLLDLVVFGLLLIIQNKIGLIWNVSSIGIGFILHILGAITAWRVLQWICTLAGNNKTLKILSKYSMSIYLFHQQFIYISLYILNGKVPPLIGCFTQ